MKKTLEDLLDENYMSSNHYFLGETNDWKIDIDSTPEKFYKLSLKDTYDENQDSIQITLDEIEELANSLKEYVKLMRSEITVK